MSFSISRAFPRDSRVTQWGQARRPNRAAAPASALIHVRPVTLAFVAPQYLTCVQCTPQATGLIPQSIASSQKGIPCEMTIGGGVRLAKRRFHHAQEIHFEVGIPVASWPSSTRASSRSSQHTTRRRLLAGSGSGVARRQHASPAPSARARRQPETVVHAQYTGGSSRHVRSMYAVYGSPSISRNIASSTWMR